LSDSILSRIAAGDSRAVQDCIDQYGNLVWSIARRFSRTAADAEDAVQEVFVDLWKSAARFDPSRASEKTFIAMVARRRLIDLMRRAERRPQTAPIPENFDVPDMKDQTAAIAEAALASRALETLKPEQRRVLLMSVYEGLSHGDIAQMTGIPLGTVKSHIRRGLNEIRELLASDPASGRKVSP
jgi:RNA polymerase sigma-70 factor (ECF subfamily)